MSDAGAERPRRVEVSSVLVEYFIHICYAVALNVFRKPVGVGAGSASLSFGTCAQALKRITEYTVQPESGVIVRRMTSSTKSVQMLSEVIGWKPQRTSSTLHFARLHPSWRQSSASPAPALGFTGGGAFVCGAGDPNSRSSTSCVKRVDDKLLSAYRVHPCANQLTSM